MCKTELKRIAITNRHLCSGDFLLKVEEVCKLQPYRLILREKDLSAEDYRNLAKLSKEIAEGQNLDLTAHFFWEEARRLNFSRIHLPMMVFSAHIDEMRKDFSEIGVSVHSLEEAVLAEKLGADYVMYGHVFETDCKKGLAPRGLGELKTMCEVLKIPVYGLGGITSENEKLVMDVGASGVCQMSSYMR